jgi:hypothetical protein
LKYQQFSATRVHKPATLACMCCLWPNFVMQWWMRVLRLGLSSQMQRVLGFYPSLCTCIRQRTVQELLESVLVYLVMCCLCTAVAASALLFACCSCAERWFMLASSVLWFHPVVASTRVNAW